MSMSPHHVHTGQDLKTLLQRTRAWLSGVVAGRPLFRHPHRRSTEQGRQAGGGGSGGGGMGGVHDSRGDDDDDDDGNDKNEVSGSGDEAAVDFAARADAISCQLGWLLARL